MTKFEYKFALNAGQSIDEPDDFVEEEIEEEFNKFGCEGWELVAVSPFGEKHSYLGYWFKRPIGSK
jgi:hypothetical protein